MSISSYYTVLPQDNILLLEKQEKKPYLFLHRHRHILAYESERIIILFFRNKIKTLLLENKTLIFYRHILAYDSSAAPVVIRHQGSPLLCPYLFIIFVVRRSSRRDFYTYNKKTASRSSLPSSSVEIMSAIFFFARYLLSTTEL